MPACGDRDIGGPLSDQVHAAAHRGRNARLLAGPGTGKTRTIVDLVASLVANGDAVPAEILCLTFTRAAAAGLRSKLRTKLGRGVETEVYTLHGFALRQLMARHANTGAGTDRPRIADDWEERNVILEDLKVMLGAANIRDVRERLKALSAAWETRPEEDPTTTHPDHGFVGALQRHKRQYGYILRAELVFLLKQTLDQDPDFRFTGGYKWVIVDEYQDLNRCDIAVIDQVVARTGSILFVAGDDDQSIYQQLRHAHPDGIRDFLASHNAEDLRLETCVRCDGGIIEVATGVITQEVGRAPKTLQRHVTAGDGLVKSLAFPGGQQEAAGIAQLADKFIAAGIPAHEILVLLRSDNNGAFSGPIDDAMRGRGIPSVVRTAETSTLDERDGRVVLAYLRLAANGRDHLAWRTILTQGNVGVGGRGIEELHALSVSNNDLALASVLDRVLADPSALPTRGPAVQRAVTTVVAKVDAIRAAIVSAGADVELQISSATATFPANPEMTAVEGELQSLSLAFSPVDLGDLLVQIALRRVDEEEAIMPASVNIMSMHKAKGLDACVVIVVAAEEQLIPGPNNRDEERRLFYVSLSRARHVLFVTHASARTGQQARSGNGDPRNHTRTTFLDQSRLTAERGADFITAFTPDLDVLSPLPNPATATPAIAATRP